MQSIQNSLPVRKWKCPSSAVAILIGWNKSWRAKILTKQPTVQQLVTKTLQYFNFVGNFFLFWHPRALLNSSSHHLLLFKFPGNGRDGACQLTIANFRSGFLSALLMTRASNLFFSHLAAVRTARWRMGPVSVMVISAQCCLNFSLC